MDATWMCSQELISLIILTPHECTTTPRLHIYFLLTSCSSLISFTSTSTTTLAQSENSVFAF